MRRLLYLCLLPVACSTQTPDPIGVVGQVADNEDRLTMAFGGSGGWDTATGGSAPECASAAIPDPTYSTNPHINALWLPGVARALVFEPDDGSFVINGDGTATLTGRLRQRSNPLQAFNLVATFYGETPTPSGSLHLDLDPSAYFPSGPVDPISWFYYPTMTATLTGVDDYAGAVVMLSERMTALQVGEGANGKNKLGASGWVYYSTLVQPFGGGFNVNGVGDFNLDLADCECLLDSGALGSASDYNVFVIGDLSGLPDIGGAAAAGGDVSLSGFSVAHQDPGGTVLIAGNDLSLSNGSVWGDAAYGNSASISASVDFQAGGSASQDSPIDWADAKAELQALSAELDALAATGTTTVSVWGVIDLVGSETGQNVFDLDASDLAAANTLNISAPAGSTVLINVRGGSASMSNMGIAMDGVSADHLITHFVDATALDLNSVGVLGSVFAPYAEVSFNNGAIDGSLVVGQSLSGTGEPHHLPFAGELSCD